MSSATLTKEVRLKPDTTSGEPAASHQSSTAEGLQPWQFFVLVGLGCATAITFLVRGQGVITVALVGVLMATAVLVGMAALRTLRPLVSADEDRVAMIGHRTRAALEREKHLTLRAIKELEFDRAMGKLAESDFTEMSGRLRARAARIMRQLDAGDGYRAQIERDLAKRLGDRPADAPPVHACASCSTANDADAKFCKNCGAKL